MTEIELYELPVFDMRLDVLQNAVIALRAEVKRLRGEVKPFGSGYTVIVGAGNIALPPAMPTVAVCEDCGQPATAFYTGPTPGTAKAYCQSHAPSLWPAPPLSTNSTKEKS